MTTTPVPLFLVSSQVFHLKVNHQSCYSIKSTTFVAFDPPSTMSTTDLNVHAVSSLSMNNTRNLMFAGCLDQLGQRFIRRTNPHSSNSEWDDTHRSSCTVCFYCCKPVLGYALLLRSPNEDNSEASIRHAFSTTNNTSQSWFTSCDSLAAGENLMGMALAIRR